MSPTQDANSTPVLHIPSATLVIDTRLEMIVRPSESSRTVRENVMRLSRVSDGFHENLGHRVVSTCKGRNVAQNAAILRPQALCGLAKLVVHSTVSSEVQTRLN